MAKGEDSKLVTVFEVKKGHLDAYIVGTTPIILNRMSEKAKRELLMPKGRKTAADKASNLKHDPLAEYRASAYLNPNPKATTQVMHLSSAFKGAMKTAALDMPGAKKAQIGRLVYVENDYVNIYGVPQLFMSITRSADMNKTPDVRTRAILPEWACKISISFVESIIKSNSIVNLLAAAGMQSGIGDWRPEKGSGNYGQFRVCSADDPDYKRIVREGGYAAQKAAFENPECYDQESEELLQWFDEEVKTRGWKDKKAAA